MAEPRMRLHHEPETTAQALFERARRLDQVAGFGYEMADFLTDLVPFLEAIASLPQQTAEPVAIVNELPGSNLISWTKPIPPVGTKLYTHPASPPAGGAVKVKALDWRTPTDHPKDPDADENLLCADGLGGVYAISKRQKVGESYLLWWAADPMSWTGFDTIDEAKAAAQADYEQRILSALASSERSGREEVIEECAKVAFERAHDNHKKANAYGANGDDASQLSCMTAAVEAMEIAAAIRNLAGTKTNEK